VTGAVVARATATVGGRGPRLPARLRGRHRVGARGPGPGGVV